jgi:hypothetical protein
MRRPGRPQQEAALGGAAAPAAPTAAPAAAAGARSDQIWSERSGARTSRLSRVRQAEPGSRVTMAIATVGKVPVTAYCEPQPCLNNGSSQSSHGGGVLVMPDARSHQRNAGACDSILRENDGLVPSLE